MRRRFYTAGVWLKGVLLALICLTVAYGGAAAAPPYTLRGDTPVDLSIMGEPLATEAQCVAYLLRRNPFPALTVSPSRLVAYFYEEARREGIRGDVAFAQALHETGNFAYGGDVVPLQNNFCGLGATGGGVRGAWFPSAQVGVRAQIQHLLAYTTARPPRAPVVDPRYGLLKRSNKFASAATWIGLNGKWAVPGRTYGQRILRIHMNILAGD